MKYAFTGTHKNYNRELHDPILREVISKLTDGEEFITGAAFGVDTFACIFAYEYFPEARHTIIVPQGWHNDIHVDLASKAKNVEVVYMPEGTGYRERNEELVSRGDFLHAFPLGKLEKSRSGTWMTVNIARNTGKQHATHRLPETT